MVSTVLWISLALVAFSYVGYPTVLAVWNGVRDVLATYRFFGGGPDRRAPRAEPAAGWPRISIVFSAFDEEACIRAKIENCLALDYPAHLVEVLVGCDGCTDRTAEIAREAGGERVRVRDLSPRSGKASVLSRLVPEAQGEIVVLTDANVLLERDALRALARRFRDPAVGAVVGRLRLLSPGGRELEEGIYWRYETFLKHLEGRLGCVLGANGGIYAIRRVLFAPLHPDTITDDFVVPIRIAVRGYEVPYAADAVAFEESADGAGREFVRRARIGAGNWQALARIPELLDPRSGFLFFAFVSHKLLRWATPLLLALALAANVAVAASPGTWGYRALLLTQCAFYLLAAAGRLGAGGPGRRVASIAHYFVLMNAALVVGLWRFVRGTQRAAWERTPRTAAEA